MLKFQVFFMEEQRFKAWNTEKDFITVVATCQHAPVTIGTRVLNVALLAQGSVSLTSAMAFVSQANVSMHWAAYSCTGRCPGVRHNGTVSDKGHIRVVVIASFARSQN